MPALKFESFKNFSTFFKILAKGIISKFRKIKIIGKYNICIYSTNLGGDREIPQEKNYIYKSFGKFCENFCEFKIFSKTATLIRGFQGARRPAESTWVQITLKPLSSDVYVRCSDPDDVIYG